MTDETFEHGLAKLITGEPGTRELRELHQQLSFEQSDPEYPVEQYALASVIRSILEYLDFVNMELEKSIGLRSEAERERVLAELTYPEASDPYAQVDHLVTQWEEFERYSIEDVTRLVDEEAIVASEES